MTELTLKLHTADGVTAWLTLDEAARRSGLNLQRLRDYAAKKYAPAGLAKKQPNAQTGQTTWFISEAADERFRAVRSAASESKLDVTSRAELAADPVQREIASARQRMLEELERQIDEDARSPRSIGVNPVIDRFADHLAERGIEGASPSSLKRWRAEWRAAGKDMLALVDRRRKGENHRETDAGFADYFELLRTLYLDENKPQKSAVIKAANFIAHRDGLAIPHDKKARRWLQELERTNAAQVTRYRGGPAAFNNTILPYIPRDRTRVNIRKANGEIVTRDMRSDEIWCADHHICDTLVEHKGKFVRPWLTAILDIRSNRIVGVHWSPDAPNKHNVLLALRNAIVRGGYVVPDKWFVDNGKDFDAWMFQGVTKQERRKFKIRNEPAEAQGILELLKVQTVHAAPYNARSKPVERFFGIFEEDFGKFTYTYCGCNPQEKPEHLAHRLESGSVETYEQYIAEAEAWIFKRHHADPLTSQLDKGKSRDEVYAENRTSPRFCKPEDCDLLLLPVEKSKVTRMGISYRGFKYHDPALVDYIGQDVALKVDPADIRTIGVWSLGMKRKIAQVQSLDLAAWGEVTDAQAKAVNQRIEEIKRTVKRLTAIGGTGYASIDKQRFLNDARRASIDQAPEPPPLPAAGESMRMVQAPFNGIANVDRAVVERPRVAAGGELIDLVALGAEGL